MGRVPILTEDVGDLENEVAKIAGQLGLVLVVLTAVGTVNHPNVPGPHLDKLDITVAVFEEPLINRSRTGTRKPALQAVQDVIKTLHIYTPRGWRFPLVCDKQAFVLAERKPFIHYDVNFTPQFVLTPRARI